MGGSIARIFLGVGVLALASCSSLNDHTQDQKITQIGDETLITWAADQKHVYVKQRDSTRQLCSSTGPDFAIASSVGGSLGGIGGAAGSTIGAGAGQSDLGLGGRSPSVLIVRDLLFRSCELTMNISASAEKAEEIFFKTLEVVKIVVKTQTEAGSSSVAVSQSSDVSAPSAAADDSDSDEDEDEDGADYET